VLLIDDEDVSRYLVRQCLEPSVRVIEASSGTEGLAIAKRVHPRAIVLDLRMPGMSGFEVLSALKADPETRPTPVVVLTAVALASSDQATLSPNAVAIFSKEVLSLPDAGERIIAALKIGADKAPDRHAEPAPR
jgi:putative two-component system response regulator